MRRKRQYLDPPMVARCQYTIILKDGMKADCGRKRTIGDLCTQHARIVAVRPKPDLLPPVPAGICAVCYPKPCILKGGR